MHARLSDRQTLTIYDVAHIRVILFKLLADALLGHAGDEGYGDSLFDGLMMVMMVIVIVMMMMVMITIIVMTIMLMVVMG